MEGLLDREMRGTPKDVAELLRLELPFVFVSEHFDFSEIEFADLLVGIPILGTPSA